MTGWAWGRLFRRGLLALLVLGIGFFVWARLFAGGPISLIPGGSLRGEVVTEPVLHWSLAGSTQYLDVESRARWLPYSNGECADASNPPTNASSIAPASESPSLRTLISATPCRATGVAPSS